MRKKLLILTLVGLALLLLLGELGINLLSALLVPVVGDAMEWRSKRLAGWHGIDCGRVRIGGDPKAATACALRAQAEGKPFRVRYDIMGYDSAVAGGVVRTPDGRLYGLSFVGNPTGAGGHFLVLAACQSISVSPAGTPLGQSEGTDQLFSTANIWASQSHVAQYRTLLVDPRPKGFPFLSPWNAGTQVSAAKDIALCWKGANTFSARSYRIGNEKRASRTSSTSTRNDCW